MIGCKVGVVVGRGFVLYDWVLAKPSGRALSIEAWTVASDLLARSSASLVHGNGCSLSVVGARPAKLQVFHRPMAGSSCQKAREVPNSRTKRSSSGGCADFDKLQAMPC